MAIVVARAERGRHRALRDAAKDLLRDGREGAERAEVGEDVLAKADDGGAGVVACRGHIKLLERTRHLEGLLDVPVLVGVDGLHHRAAGEDERQVLIVALAIAKDCAHARGRRGRE